LQNKKLRRSCHKDIGNPSARPNEITHHEDIALLVTLIICPAQAQRPLSKEIHKERGREEKDRPRKCYQQQAVLHLSYIDSIQRAKESGCEHKNAVGEKEDFEGFGHNEE